MAKKPVQSPKPVVKPATKPANRTTARNAESGSGKWWTYVFIVLAVTAACYLSTLSHGFVNWDDDPNITENQNLLMVGKGQSWGTTISNIFDLEKGNVIGNYNPLPILTFAIEKSITDGENSPKLIHFNNLLLHLITTFFVMLLLRQLGFGMWGILLGGLLFGIHPMRVESVAWATERKDVLFGAFFFAALVVYDKWLKKRQEGDSAIGLYAGTVVLALLSGFSKVQAVTLPLSMLCMDYWYRRPMNFRLILEKTPFWLISLAIGLANLHTLRVQGSTDDSEAEFNFLNRLSIGAYSLCVYLYKLVLPWPMSPLYPYPKPLPIYIHLAPLAFIGLCYLLYRAWKSDARIWVFGSLFFFFNVMFLLQVLGAGQGFLADRFTYVPYFGMFAIAAYYVDKMYQSPERKGMAQGILAIVGVVSAVWTYQQVSVWKNGETLWTHVMKFENKTSHLPYWNRGQYLRGQGKFDPALKDYTQAITMNPKNPELYNSRGKTYFDMGTSGKYGNQSTDFVKKAIDDYTNGLSQQGVKPKTRAEILINRGAAFGAVNQFDNALRDLNEGLGIDSTNKNGYFNRSIAFFTLKQYDNALADYQRYLRYDPNNANIWYESGMLLRATNKNNEAINNLTKAIQLNPKFGVAYLERARAYLQSGNRASAQQDYQRASQLGEKTTDIDARLLAQ